MFMCQLASDTLKKQTYANSWRLTIQLQDIILDDNFVEVGKAAGKTDEEIEHDKQAKKKVRVS